MSDDKVFNLDSYEKFWDEYVATKKEEKRTKKLADQFAEAFKKLANGAKVFKIGGQEAAKIVAGQLNKSLLAKEQPDVIKKYTKVIAVERFDEAEFKEQEPELYKQYQAQRLVLSGETE